MKWRATYLPGIFLLGRTNSKESSSRCSVYLAESSINNAGYGVFAGKDYNVGERVGTSGLGIQILDPDESHGDTYLSEELINFFGWNPIMVGGDMEASEVFTVLPGAGMLINVHPILSNVMEGGLTEEPILDRAEHPGAGANSAYHNFTFLAKQPIHVGQEFFASASNNWFEAHENGNDFKEGDFVPSAAVHQIADKLVQDLVTYKEQHPQMSEATFLDIMMRMKHEMIHYDALKILVPDTLDELHRAAEMGTASSMLNNRNIDWLQQHGKCLDNLRAGVSTIPGTGRGAFATRFIPKGSIVSPSPLVHFLNKEKLLRTNANFTTFQDSNQYQLLLNYCFGHAKSSLLLCPTTSVTLINHSPTLHNVKLQWTTSTSSNNKQNKSENYRMRPLADLDAQSSSLSERNTKLAFDFVATRDIQEGEEVFLDYGTQWQHAWDEHVRNWQPKSGNYIPASVLNDKHATIPTSTPDHTTYLCELEPFARDIEYQIEEIPEEDYRANPSLNRQSWDNYTKLMYLENNFLWWWPCDVTGVISEELFRVTVFQRSADDLNNRPPIRRFKNFPRSSIKFVDKPYHSDQHLAKAFRHYIPIPDEIFPLHWRDDYVSAKSVKLGAKNEGVDKDKDQVRVNREYKESLRNAKCGIYTATSTIPNAGKGTYVGVPMPSSGIDLGPRIPVIPITDFASDTWDAFDYTWSPGPYIAEFEGTSIQVLTTNEGCMANFHPGLINMVMNDATYKPLLDRGTDPGAGAFSDYWNFSFRSDQAMMAGDEVFISYGESWFDSRAYLKNVPLSGDYKSSNNILASLHGLSKYVDKKDLEQLLRLVKDDIVLSERARKIFQSLETLKDIQHIIERNGTAQATTERRSLEWLEENGQCLDHVYVQDSNIPQAGKGAFARRPITKGDVIIPAPMLNSWGRDTFNMTRKDTPKGVNTKQLVYNYHWGHPDSSLLLFPTNTAITINHASTRNAESLGTPNAELRWSVTDKKSKYFLQATLDNLKKEHYATVVLDFVATRDILPDEEILIDYGRDWENAWKLHVENFRSLCESNSTSTESCVKSSKAVHLMNDDKFNPTYHSWSDDHFSVCSGDSLPKDSQSVITLIPIPEGDENKEHPDDPTVYNYRYVFKDMYYDFYGFDYAANAEYWYPCVILGGSEEENLFDVVYVTYEENPEYPDGGVLRRTRTLKASELRFINKPYKSDMHWNGAFRHEMKIPDDIFPTLWKDLL